MYAPCLHASIHNMQTCRHADSQPARQTNKHFIRHIYIYTYIHTYIHFVALRYVMLCCTALRCVVFCCVALPCIAFHCVTCRRMLHYIAAQYIAYIVTWEYHYKHYVSLLQYITLHYIVLHGIALRRITLHTYTYVHTYTNLLQYITLHFMT